VARFRLDESAGDHEAGLEPPAADQEGERGASQAGEGAAPAEAEELAVAD